MASLAVESGLGSKSWSDVRSKRNDSRSKGKGKGKENKSTSKGNEANQSRSKGKEANQSKARLKEVYYKKPWSEVKSEVHKPYYKVRFVPGDNIVYCCRSSSHLLTVLLEAKELAWRKSKVEKKEPPYKVGFPYPRVDRDPRLGTAQRLKESVFAKKGIDDDSDYSVSDDESEPEEESEDDEGLHLITVDPNNEPITITRPAHEIPAHELLSSPKINYDKEERKTKHSLREQYNRRVVNEAQNLKDRDCEFADAAIKFYNEKHTTDYEIVETLGSYSGLYIGFWFHCNFRARRKSDAACGRDFKPKLFFAEIYQLTPGSRIVDDCMMMEEPVLYQSGDFPPKLKTDDFVLGCRMCGDHLLHPINGFKNGRRPTPTGKPLPG